MQDPRICILENVYAEVCTNFYRDRSNMKISIFDELFFSAWNPYSSSKVTDRLTTRSFNDQSSTHSDP